MPRASERLAWAARLVDPAPGDRLLEVGCGHGVLVGLLAERVGTGHVVGLDRSPAMIAAARTRNRTAVAEGRVSLQAATLTDADLPDHGFDVVVSFDVRAFWTPPAPEWDVVRRVLAPAGRVVVALSVMSPEAVAGIDAAVRDLAGARGLVPTALHREGTAPIPSAAVELRPHSQG
jgi:ubiquinone/menaquinone biosynthesis C-methylase UbiE